jgi:hypothetical protein
LISNFLCLGPFVEVLFVFNFILQPQLTKYYVLQCAPHSLNFHFFSLVCFVKNLVIFNFILQFQIDGIIFFNLVLIILISIFFSLKVITLLNLTL